MLLLEKQFYEKYKKKNSIIETSRGVMNYSMYVNKSIQALM